VLRIVCSLSLVSFLFFFFPLETVNERVSRDVSEVLSFSETTFSFHSPNLQ